MEKPCDALDLLITDYGVSYDVALSNHPACKRYWRWLCHEIGPAVRKTGKYTWPGAQAELEAMVTEALNAAGPPR